MGAANEKRVGDVAGFDDAAPGRPRSKHAQNLVEFAPEAEQAGIAQLGGRVVLGVALVVGQRITLSWQSTD